MTKTAPKPGKNAGALIQCWSTDPADGFSPLRVAVPKLPGNTLAIHITATQPPAEVYPTGSASFRYWTAAEVLRRAADFWQSVGCPAWQPTVGATLQVKLDAGEDLNAYYSREDGGLSFFHDTVTKAGQPGQSATVYSGESPDVVAHELGHAVLDALKPQLWNMGTAEAAAFHESFGDMSAILTALQLPSVREAVVSETQGQLWRNSSVARLAEQLGFAIRQLYPSLADADCLRNASVSWLYRDPTKLSAQGPNSVLTSEPHNFSRIFTSAFLDALGHMVTAAASPAAVTADHVLAVSHDMGRLLVQAVQNAPLRTQFYQAVAEQLVIGAGKVAQHGAGYVQAITAAMVRHGLLAAPHPAAPGAAKMSFAHTVAFASFGTDAAGVADAAATTSSQISLDGSILGLATTLLVDAPAVDDQQARRPMGILATTSSPDRESAVQSFVENLARLGHIEVPEKLGESAAFLQMIQRPKHVTHRLATTAAGMVLERVRVDCGCGYRH